MTTLMVSGLDSGSIIQKVILCEHKVLLILIKPVEQKNLDRCEGSTGSLSDCVSVLSSSEERA